MATLSLLALSALTGSALAADSLASINHVVLFMQENRAFDHYFGTMSGVRGFADPQVQMNGETSVFDQLVDSAMSTETTSLKNWYVNYLGGNYTEATQCMTAGSNGYMANHAAYNGGMNDHWAMNNTPWSWSHFRRADLPVHFGIAEGWTVGDMYQQSVIAATNPNRVSWASGSINVPGGPQTPNEGGVYLDNNENIGCEATNLNCYPLTWKTVPEFYQDAGVSWQLYQNVDNFDDNPLHWFKQFRTAKPESQLALRGNSKIANNSLGRFYEAAAAGTLPMVSYIVGPAELSEHPPYLPKDGAWLQQKVLNAVTSSPAYNSTVLIISYDETGGWGDHVTPYHSPEGTPGEWLNDPYDTFGYTFSGPGFRVPFYIVSPWTRSSQGTGTVFTENADHISQIKFVEEWLAAKGINAVSDQVPAWRRAHMSDLTKAFDFSSPDYSIPSIPVAEKPSQNAAGAWNGYAVCEAEYSPRPPVPYTNQTASNTLTYEEGFKLVRGQLTEGRYLTFEMNGFALSNPGSNSTNMTTTAASSTHNDAAQRFLVDQIAEGVNEYYLVSNADGRYSTRSGSLTSSVNSAAVLAITDMGNGAGYSVQDTVSGKYWHVTKKGVMALVASSNPAGFAVFSVTYSS